MSEDARGATGGTIVLVGLMGAGKSCIGRRLAQRLELPFVDADREIELAAGCSIPTIFSLHGEAAFRDGEHRVIARLLDEPAHVLATGGGAFMDERTRALIKERAVSIWLRAEIDVLVRRVARRSNRPLLQVEDPRAKLTELIALRHPVYGLADIVVDSEEVPPEITVDRVLAALAAFRSRHASPDTREGGAPVEAGRAAR
jgi:shikimate kinase